MSKDEKNGSKTKNLNPVYYEDKDYYFDLRENIFVFSYEIGWGLVIGVSGSHYIYESFEECNTNIFDFLCKCFTELLEISTDVYEDCRCNHIMNSQNYDGILCNCNWVNCIYNNNIKCIHMDCLMENDSADYRYFYFMLGNIIGTHIDEKLVQIVNKYNSSN